jgi:hypothetical protein
MLATYTLRDLLLVSVTIPPNCRRKEVNRAAAVPKRRTSLALNGILFSNRRTEAVDKTCLSGNNHCEKVDIACLALINPIGWKAKLLSVALPLAREFLISHNAIGAELRVQKHEALMSLLEKALLLKRNTPITPVRRKATPAYLVRKAKLVAHEEARRNSSLQLSK